jgi:hypothetical protein
MTLLALRVAAVGAIILVGCVVMLMGRIALYFIAEGGWAWLGVPPALGFGLLFLGLGALLVVQMLED